MSERRCSSSAEAQPFDNSIPIPSNNSVNIESLQLAFSTCLKESQSRIRRAQKRLKDAGFSTGGRPPFGYERWLVDSNHKPIRVLAEGERVLMSGHKVKLLPDKMKSKIITRIYNLSKSKSPKTIALILQRAGVPTPSSKRYNQKWTSRMVARILKRADR